MHGVDWKAVRDRYDGESDSGQVKGNAIDGTVLTGRARLPWSAKLAK